MHRLIRGFSRISYRDIWTFFIQVFCIVNLIGMVGWTISVVYVLVYTGRWTLWPW